MTKKDRSVLIEGLKKLSADVAELAALLNEKGFNVARRTVAKYREALSIPIAKMRRR